MRHFTSDQLLSLIEAVPERHRLMIKVCFWHGLRTSELVGLRAKDIQHGYLKVQRKKGSLATLQPFVVHKNPKLSEHEGLKELAKLPPETVLFPLTRNGVGWILREANKKLDLPKCHPHMLRHTTAHTMLNGGKKINEVQKYLGHKSGNSTLMYLMVTEEEAAEGMGSLI